jgi:hypothetical protein
MELGKLADLYCQRVSCSSPSREKLIEELAWLTESGWSTESIFFSINYGAKYYPSELEESLKECLDNNRHEMIKYYQVAKTKREVKSAEEREKEYDSGNTFKRADTPKWFGKGIDFNLFK